MRSAAVDAADNPNGDNPFITHSALPEAQLTEEQEAAVDAADNPNGENPFITHSALPEPQLTPNQKAAMDESDKLNANNRVVSMSDLRYRSPLITRAAGVMDLLTKELPPTRVGNLKAVDNDPAKGLATLSFSSYRLSRQNRYIVKALSVHAQAGKDFRDSIIVEFVEFHERGFTLHMIRLRDKKPQLGPCMIEVSEM